MCGIFGYIGNKNKVKTCLQGLKLLEYRGYDSAGIAGITNGEIYLFKNKGKINALEEKININTLNLDIAIGHTRWATHGIPSKKNAHPHIDHKTTLAIAHNGIIDNFASIKNMLLEKNIEFTSDTDTEVIAQLISYYYKGNLLEALSCALKLLKGSYAIALIHKDYPNQIIAASKESPIAIGYDDKNEEALLSSDPNAFLGRNLNVLFLKNNEIAKINLNKISIYNQKLAKINKKSEKFISKNIKHTKDGYEHFMLKEIHEQPLTIQKAFFGRIQEEKVEFEDLKIDPKFLKNINNILIVACGTSYHAALLAADLFEKIAKIPSRAEIASEMRYKDLLITKNTLIIAISQSGETADTIAAIKHAKKQKVKVLSFINVKNSTITRESDSSIFLKAGPEFSVCSTKAFTSQITVLYLFVIYLAQLKKTSIPDIKYYLNELKKVPDLIEHLLKNNNIEQVAKKYSKYEKFFFLGRNLMYPTAMEAALKLKEISYLNANAYTAGELKHGPIALLDRELPIIAFVANNQTYEKILSNLMEVKARNAPIVAFAADKSEELEDIADDVIYLPKSIDELSILQSSVAGQLFAYYIAKEKKTDIDQPRNLAKSVTVE